MKALRTWVEDHLNFLSQRLTIIGEIFRDLYELVHSQVLH